MSDTVARPVVIRRTVSPVDAIAAFGRAAVRRVQREMRIRRAQRHLERMPDYLLRDAGIHRSEVGAMVRSERDAFRAMARTG